MNTQKLAFILPLLVMIYSFNVLVQEIDDEPDPFDIPIADSPIQSDEIPMDLEEDYREDTLGDERTNKKEKKEKIYIKGKATVVDGDTSPSITPRFDSVELMLQNLIFME